MNEAIEFNFGSETITQAVMAALARHGLYAVRSFDLRSALAAHPGCECPHHGTAQCNCQYVVLLIYGNVADPVVLTVHSHDGRTWANIVHDAMTTPDPGLAEEITAGLVEAALTLETASIKDATSEPH